MRLLSQFGFLFLIPMSATTANSVRSEDTFYLFGGSKPWHPTTWKTTDDRLRGGASISHLTPIPHNNTVRFHGTLDIATLGGAGFASQFSPSPSKPSTPSNEIEQDGFWNLTAFSGISLSYSQGDGKVYTLILKDSTPLPASLSDPEPRRDGREKASVSWEVQFTASSMSESAEGKDETLFFPWREFRATFRGRPVEGLEGGVETGGVRRVGVMMRSGFGKQEGGFGVVLGGIGVGRVGEGGREVGEL